jgi:hypothetical protein
MPFWMEGGFALSVSGPSYPGIFLQVIFCPSCSSLIARLNERLFPKPSTSKVSGISKLLGVEIRGCPQERILSCSLAGGPTSFRPSSALGVGSGIFFSTPRLRMDRAPVGFTSAAGLTTGPGGIRVGTVLQPESLSPPATPSSQCSAQVTWGKAAQDEQHFFQPQLPLRGLSPQPLAGLIRSLSVCKGRPGRLWGQVGDRRTVSSALSNSL